MPNTSNAAATAAALAKARLSRPMADIETRLRRQFFSARLALLDAIRADPARRAKVSDVRPRVNRAPIDSDRWLDAVPFDLAYRGLIVRDGVVSVTYPGGYTKAVVVWRGVDDDKIDAHREELRAWLAARPGNNGTKV